MAVRLFFDPPRHDRHAEGYAGGRGPAFRRTDEDDAAVEPGAPDTALPFAHPDRPLIEALRRGDTAAFEALYKAHAPAVYEYAQGYVSADAADDVVQDLFLTLWRRRESVVIHRSVRAYLFGAARLRALQMVRRDRTTDAVLARTELPITTATDPVEVAEVRDAVARALMTLPGRTRELLALRWVYNLSYPEAAAVLGVSTEAAKKLGRRAEVALAPLLERFQP